MVILKPTHSFTEDYYEKRNVVEILKSADPQSKKSRNIIESYVKLFHCKIRNYRNYNIKLI